MEWLKASFKVLECIGVVGFLEGIVIPKLKCIIHHLKCEPCEDCDNQDKGL